jgi:hypothetical protein
MNVKELIEKLREFDEELEIFVDVETGMEWSCYEVEDVIHWDETREVDHAHIILGRVVSG